MSFLLRLWTSRSSIHQTRLNIHDLVISEVFWWCGPWGDSKEAANIFSLFSACHSRWWRLWGITQQVLPLGAEETKFTCVIVQGQTIGNMAWWNREDVIESVGRRLRGRSVSKKQTERGEKAEIDMKQDWSLWMLSLCSFGTECYYGY